jgi:hypothetical protein
MGTDEDRRRDAQVEDQCPVCREQIHWADRWGIECLDLHGMCPACMARKWEEEEEP